MDSTVKSLVITGAAAEDATRSRQKKISTRKQRQIVKEEDDELLEQAKQHAQKQVQTQLQTQLQQTQIQQPQQKPVINLESKVIQPQLQNQQVKKPVESNVILNPPKVQRVKLQPKAHHTQAPVTELNTTRKARRIHLSTTNLSHRFTRAKRVKEDTEKKPVASIRDYLVSKGVIQQKSKAPEKMLRSMYSDFMLLKDQAL
jgi:hypothetical protein